MHFAAGLAEVEKTTTFTRLTPQLAVVGCCQAARWGRPFAGSSSNRCAVRAAVPTAQGPDVRAPMPSTVSPQPAMIHHAGWLAAVKPMVSGPVRPELSTEPTTATPSAAPTWRLVEATAAATPAWLRGIPDSAVFVIGALTSPNPKPCLLYTSDAADEEDSVDLGGRRIIKKK